MGLFRDIAHKNNWLFRALTAILRLSPQVISKLANFSMSAIFTYYYENFREIFFLYKYQ